MLSHTTPFRVRFNETDPLGIVWHGHYITYFEDGREAFGEAHGISYKHIQDNGLFAPIVKCTCEFKLPLRHGETASIETNFINHPAAKMVFQYTIRNTSGQVVATGETIQVFTDQKDGELFIINPLFFENWKKEKGLL